MNFTEDYDPGFLNVPGYGQSATNPLAPVFFSSLGVVESISVYDSVYAANKIAANVSVDVGRSSLSQVGMNIAVPTFFEENVNCEKPLRVKDITNTDRIIVNDKEYVEKLIKCDNGTFRVLARK